MSTPAAPRGARANSSASNRLQLEQVALNLGGRAIIQPLSFELRTGSFIALLGPNGSGKTSLTKLGLGLLTPTAGAATLNGQPLTSFSSRRRAAHLAWLPQRWEPSEPLPVEELIIAARYRFAEPYAVAKRRALSALERVGARMLVGCRVNEISGGELQRVLLAALVAQEAPLIFCDEPANHLDPAYQIATYRLLGELWRAGAGVLCVTHDVNLLAHVGADVRILGLKRGELHLDSHYQHPQLSTQLSALFDVPFAVVNDGAVRQFYVQASRADLSRGGAP